MLREHKKCLTDSVVLSRLDLTKHLCLFTDASDKFYAACITAIPSCDTEKLPTEMNHEIIDTMSGKFSGSAERWSIQSKEAFAIKHAMDKWSHWFDGPNDLIVFTDSPVVKVIFDPHLKGTPAALGAAQAGRVARWALFLRRFSFEIRHLPGSLNVFADYLSRDGSMYAILARPDAGFSNSEKTPAEAGNKPVQPGPNNPACARAVEICTQVPDELKPPAVHASRVQGRLVRGERARYYAGKYTPARAHEVMKQRRLAVALQSGRH